MSKLFKILDGINGCDYADETLEDVAHIENYAEAIGESISQAECLKIQKAGQKWRADVRAGNGEWSRMRHEAEAALDAEGNQMTGNEFIEFLKSKGWRVAETATGFLCTDPSGQEFIYNGLAAVRYGTWHDVARCLDLPIPFAIKN